MYIGTTAENQDSPVDKDPNRNTARIPRMDAQIDPRRLQSRADAFGDGRPRLQLVKAGADSPLQRDEQLGEWVIAIAMHQDRDAFASLFKHLAPRMKGWLWKTGSSSDEAEEIVQDAFVNLWRKAAQFDPARADVAAWLFTIARNLRVDRRRAHHHSWAPLDDFEAQAIVDTADTQEQLTSRKQQAQRVRSAIGDLTDDQRMLIQLSFYEDMSHSIIAEKLEMPLGTVKSKLRRAASCLRALLEERQP